MSATETRLQPGDRVGPYEVTRTNAFGPLPRARIVKGPNRGVEVYLTSGLRP